MTVSLSYIQGLLSAWEIATFDGSAASKADKAVAYYETILYDTIIGDTNKFPIVNALDSTFSSIKAETYETIFEYCESLDEFELVDLVEIEDISLNDPLFNDLVDQLADCKELKESFKLFGKVSDVIGDAKTIVEVIDRVSALEALTENKNQMKQILTDINTATDDPALALACLKMSSVLDETYSSEEVIRGLLAGEGLVKVLNKATNAAWDMVLETAVGAGLTIAVKAGQELGKLGAGILFSTDEDVECVYSMNALYELEDQTVKLVKNYESKYKSSPTDANAKQYNEAFKQLMRIYMQGCEYSIKYAQITNESGLINQIFKNFEKEDYKKLISLLNDLHDTYGSYLEFIDTCVYDNYLAGIPNEKSYSQSIRKKISDAKTSDVTEDDVKKYLDYSETVSNAYTNRVIDSNWTLTEDVTMFGNLTVNANIDINGYTLTVNGDLYQSGGTLLVHDGSLIIGGDYRLYGRLTYDDDKAEVYWGSYKGSPTLRMTYENDYIYVGGDFYNAFGAAPKLTAGVLELNGDFYNVGDTNIDGWFAASGTHKTILSGENDQTVHFKNTNGCFNDLEIQNSKKRSINLINGYCTVAGNTTCDGDSITIVSKDGSFGFGTLNCKELSVNGNVGLNNTNHFLSNNISFDGDVDASGNISFSKTQVIINGVFNSSGDIDLGGGNITISKTFYQTGGTLLIHNSSLRIGGDYRLYGRLTYDDDKAEVYWGSYKGSPTLRMTYENDYIYVGGDFYNAFGAAPKLTAGVLELNGDFYNVGDTNIDGWFAASGTHKTILSGENDQTVHFKNTNGSFNNLEVKNNGSKTITFPSYFNANNVIINSGSVTITSDSTNANITNIFMRIGAKITLTGNMNGLTSVNKASFSSDMTSCVSVSANTITAVVVGNAKVTAANSSDSTTINIVVESPLEVGDVNCDGEINVADAVLLQKWLLAVPNKWLPNWKYSDMDNDNKLDVFDLVFLKRKLIYG